MKKLFCLIISVVIASTFCLSCSAKSVTFEADGIELSIQEDFAIFTNDNLDKMASDLEDLGLTKNKVSADMTSGNHLMMAVSREYGYTVTLSKTQNDFSKTVGDLYRINDEKTKENVKTILLGNTLSRVSKIQEIEQNGALFYRLVYNSQHISSSSTDSSTSSPKNEQNNNLVSSSQPHQSDTSSEYSVIFNTTNSSAGIVYATVMNDTIYTLCLLDSSGTLTERSNDVIDWIFKNLKYTVEYSDVNVKYNTNRLLSVLIWISIPVGLLLAVLLIVSIIRDYRQKHAEENLKSITPKKPRR